MNKLRSDVDALEPLVPDTVWPMPVYADLLFRV
jgi:glutamine synthetase